MSSQDDSPSATSEWLWPGTLEDLAEQQSRIPHHRRADSAPALCGEEGEADIFNLEDGKDSVRNLSEAPVTGLAKYDRLRQLEKGSFGSIQVVLLRQNDRCVRRGRSCLSFGQTGRAGAHADAPASADDDPGERTVLAMKTTDLRDVSVERLGVAPEFAPNSLRVKRAMTEYRILTDMPKHALLPRLLEAFTSRCNTLFHLIMEFVPGTDLRTRLEHAPNRRFSECEARFFAAEMLLALDHLHSSGFLYRDLKPENVMLNEHTGHLKLVDFDLAVRMESGDSTSTSDCVSAMQKEGVFDAEVLAASESFGTPPMNILKDLSPRDANRLKVPLSVCGTAEYIAPEVLAGSSCSAASDRWQVGVILHEMLWGDVPFRGSRPHTTFLLIATARVELPTSGPEVSEAARALILGMLRRTGGWGQPSDPRIRIGGRSLKEIQEHPFFDEIDWQNIVSQPPPCPIAPCRNAKGECVASMKKGIEDW